MIDLAGRGQDPPGPRTGKEREVLARLAEGRSNRSIAASLHVTPATVKTHLAHIYDKLGASDRHEAVMRGRQGAAPLTTGVASPACLGSPST